MKKSHITLLFLLLSTLTLKAAGQENIHFIIYGEIGCPSCEQTLTLLTNMYGKENVEFKDASENPGYAKSETAIHILLYEGRKYETPITGVYVRGTLIAVVEGLWNKQEWENITSANISDGILVYYPGEEARKIQDKELIEQINQYFKETGQTPTTTPPETPQTNTSGNTSKTQTKNLNAIIATVLLSAASDSVNPCTFSLFTGLLLLSLSSKGKKHTLLVGTSFILTIFTCYYLIGLGLAYIIPKIIWIRPILAVAAITMGAYEVYSSRGGEYRSTMPRPLRKIAKIKIREIAEKTGIIWVLIFAALLSFTLLPCSGGPYLVATSLLSDLTLKLRILGLLLYNIVFVAPLAAIMLGIYLLSLKTTTVKIWRSQKLHLMGLTSGLILIALGIYLLKISI